MSVMDDLKAELRENAISFTEDEDGSITVNTGDYDRPPYGAYTDATLVDLIGRTDLNVSVLPEGGLKVEAK